MPRKFGTMWNMYYSMLARVLCMYTHTHTHTHTHIFTANFFASGSKDGMILLWSTNTLNPMKMFQCAGSASFTQSLREPMPSSVVHVESEINSILALSEVCVCMIVHIIVVLNNNTTLALYLSLSEIPLRCRG